MTESGAALARVLKKDAVLVCCIGSLGKIGLAGRSLATNQQINAIEFDEKLVFPKYGFYACQRLKPKLAAIAPATTVPIVNKSRFGQLEIPLPPLPEQRRIAAILDKADALRHKRCDALAQLDCLAQSIFVEMVGEPTVNPNGWPRRALKELGKVTTGGTPPSSKEGMFGGDIPFVTPGDLESRQPIKRWLTEAGAQEVGTVRAGATLVCCIGATIGKMGMAQARSSFNQQLNAVEWYPELVDDRFGLAVLQFFKPTIAMLGASTTLPILKKSSFEKLSIPVPPRSLQEDLAKRLAQVEQLEETQQEALQASAALFESLQCGAFQGAL